jgi:aminopeptidase N
VANKPWPYGEYLAYDVADYQVHIQLEGIPANSKKGPQIAAGVPGEIQGDRHFFQLRNARSFAWSASQNYQMQMMETGGITLQGYIYPEHQTAGDAALKNVADALVLFSQLFGPYPRESFTIVEADFSDGREYDGLIFLSADYHAEYNDTPKNFLTLLSVHETSHQWWYGLIGNNQAEEPWIDEALATYSELLFYENYYPELVEWWWQFRVNYFRPQGYINRSIYDYERFLPYVHGVYLRGALFIQELRDAMGDQAFFSFLADYVAQSANQYISAKDFFTLLTANSQVDLEPILDKYFDQP